MSEEYDYRSKFEAKFAKDLIDRGVQFSYEEDTLNYIIPAKKSKYKPDFKVHYTKIVDHNFLGIAKLGQHSEFYVETKGYFDAADRAKLLLVRESNPNLDLRLVFMNPNNKIHKKSPTTYADWADKHGFKWAKGTLPEEWLE